MLCTQNKIKFLLQHSKLLKIASFIICGVFFTTVNANLQCISISDQPDKPESDSSYFLDIRSLQKLHNFGGSIIYIEKENPTAEWIVLPIKSSMRDYYKTVANVVATEFHKRIDEHSLVPLTKFLIKKNNGNNSGYKLLGSAYKKISSTAPIREIMKNSDFYDYANNIIYINYNIERHVSMWNYLGLPMSPDPANLELSQDSKLVRYDYYNSFQYQDSEILEKCFCTSDFPISDYNCNVERIKTFEQELLSKQNKETLEKVISEINIDSKKYLEEKDLAEIKQALEDIMSFKSWTIS